MLFNFDCSFLFLIICSNFMLVSINMQSINILNLICTNLSKNQPTHCEMSIFPNRIIVNQLFKNML